MGKNRSVILVNGFTVPPCFLSMPGAAGFLIVVVGTFTGLIARMDQFARRNSVLEKVAGVMIILVGGYLVWRHKKKRAGAEIIVNPGSLLILIRKVLYIIGL